MHLVLVKLKQFIFVTAKYKVNLSEYPANILLAFGESVIGNEEVMIWLLNNGYPEMAALANAIRGSEEACAWLMKSGFPELAALDAAIDHDVKAYLWLRQNNFALHAAFSDACNHKPDAMAWFAAHDLHIFLVLAQKINSFRDNQKFDYHKVHF